MPVRALYTIDGGDEHIKAFFDTNGALTLIAKRFQASNIGVMKFAASRSKSQQVELPSPPPPHICHNTSLLIFLAAQ